MKTLKSLLPSVFISVTLMSLAIPSSAADKVWQGGGADNNWTTPANWVGGLPSTGDALFFNGSTGLASTNDFPVAARFNSINFNSGAGAFVLGGNALTLAGCITNNSAAGQKIDLGLMLTNSCTLNAANGAPTVGGIISDSPAPPQGIVRIGAGTLTLTNANTFTGSTTLNAGTLILASTNALAMSTNNFFSIAGTPITLNGGTLQLNTDMPVNLAHITMGGSATVVLNRTTPGAGFNTTFGDYSIPGTTTLTVTNGPNITSGTAGLTFLSNGGWYANGRVGVFDIAGACEVTMLATPLPYQGHTITVIKNGLGRLILGGNYGQWDGGTITLNAGTLELRVIPGDNNQYRAPLNAAAGSMLTLKQDASFNYYSIMTLNGSMTTTVDRVTAGAGVTHTLSTLTVAGNYSMTLNAGTNMTSGTAGLIIGPCTLNGDAQFLVNNGAAASTVLTLPGVSGTDRNLAISGNGNAAITGVINTGTGAVTKAGTGTLTLSATNTYMGPTVINGGTVVLTAGASITNSSSIFVGNGAVLNSSAAGILYIPPGATLAGSGTISGAVSATDGIILSPGGTNTTGALTISSNLTVAAGTVYNWQYDNTGNTSDLIQVMGNLSLPTVLTVNVSRVNSKAVLQLPLFSYTGTCNITNLGSWVTTGEGGKIRNDTNRRLVTFVTEGLVIQVK